MATAAGGAGEPNSPLDPLAGILQVKGALRLIPYNVIKEDVKAAKPIGAGSTGALLINVRGRPMVYKFGPPGNIANEYIAYQLFEAMGARVPTSYLVVTLFEKGDGFIPNAVLTEYLTGGVTIREAFEDGLPTKEGERRVVRVGERASLLYSIQSEFLYHALLANWDAKNWENHMIVPEKDGDRFDVDHPYVLDPGGALFYRATGEPKMRGDLSTAEITEFYTMPLVSYDTFGQFYYKLTNNKTLFGVVCRKAASIDDAKLMKVVEEMRPLFGFLPKDADLPGFIAGRLAYLRAYCEAKISLTDVRLRAENAEFYGLHLPVADTSSLSRETALARQRYASKVDAIREETTRGLRMRGKREIVIPPPIEPENYERFHVYNRPVPRVRRHAGVDKYGFEYNSNSDSFNSNNTENSTRHDVYPKPALTMSIDRSKDAQRVRHAILAPREDPAIDAWLREQVAFIKELPTRDYNILTSYTRNGDVLVNSYLRGTLRTNTTELIRASLEVSDDYPSRPVALAYSLYDQFPELTRTGRLTLLEGVKTKADLLDEEGDINMELVRDLMTANLAYFGNAANLGTLLEQYRRDLVSILERAPRAPHAFTVFRGLQSESHARDLEFRNIDFLSTSMSPEYAAKLFTRKITDKVADLVPQTYRCCMYELEVRPDVPCLYMQFVSQYPNEYEILIAPGMAVTLEPTVYLKLLFEGERLIMRNLRDIFRHDSLRHHTKIAVVEGNVRKLPPRKATSAAAIFNEEGSFEDLGTIHKSKKNNNEYYASVKPRSQMVGRNRIRRRSKKPSWNRNKRRNTIRLSTISENE